MIVSHGEYGRRAGKTTKQMLSAPHGSVFVWCNSNILYAKNLAKRLGRDDLIVVSPSRLERSNEHRGRRYSAVCVDHATELTLEQAENLERINCELITKYGE